MTDYRWTEKLARSDLHSDTVKRAVEFHAFVESLGAHPILTDASAAAMNAILAVGAWEEAGSPGAAKGGE